MTILAPTYALVHINIPYYVSLYIWYHISGIFKECIYSNVTLNFQKNQSEIFFKKVS